MIDAHEATDKGDADMFERYKHFLFAFAVATVHELAHVFIGYIGQNGALGPGTAQTPVNITCMNYGEQVDPAAGIEGVGEAGRYLEDALFGGTMEFYRVPKLDDGQSGMPYLLHWQDDTAWRIHPRHIDECVSDLRGKYNFPFSSMLLISITVFDFPFTALGGGVTAKGRKWKNLHSLGWKKCRHPYKPELLFMKAHEE